MRLTPNIFGLTKKHNRFQRKEKTGKYKIVSVCRSNKNKNEFDDDIVDLDSLGTKFSGFEQLFHPAEYIQEIHKHTSKVSYTNP